MAKFVYVISKPGSDLDGEDTNICAESREEADRLAEKRRVAWNCTALRFIGFCEGHGSSARFKPGVPVAELPEWAREVA